MHWNIIKSLNFHVPRRSFAKYGRGDGDKLYLVFLSETTLAFCAMHVQLGRNFTSYSTNSSPSWGWEDLLP
jgi:hypothetical protein